MTKYYYAVEWKNSSDDEPYEYFCELDAELYETRKVEFYRDGRVWYADADQEVGDTFLSDCPWPTPEEMKEIVAESEEETEERPISAEEFEAIWQRVTASKLE